MHKLAVLLLSVAILSSCGNEKPVETGKIEEKKAQSEKLAIPKFDIQGHRGARGYYPENTLNGFRLAISQGVTTLEMDAIISKDGEVIVSHEPWLSHVICLNPDGQKFSEEEEKAFNMYKMNYEEIQEFNCGRLEHPRFPEQDRADEPKPRLADIIRGVESYLSLENRASVWYNIETKSSPEGDNIYHPEPKEFVGLLVKTITAGGIKDRCVIQSFDVRTLQEAHRQFPEIPLALLVEGSENGIEKLDQLGFVPEIYSPNFESLNFEMVKGLQRKGMRVIPWTVNEPGDIEKLMAMGVDGIISDYPDRVVYAYEEISKALSMNQN